MLKTRAIIKNANGSYSGIFGQGNGNFIYGADALAQILTHQILTLKGELKTRTDYGISWFSKDEVNNYKTLIDTQIKNILINNYYVKSIMSFTSNVNAKTNSYNAIIKVLTTEGLLELNI